MSAAEVIEQIKALPPQEKKTVFRYLRGEFEDEALFHDEFSILGSDAEGADVSYAYAAQAQAVSHEQP